MFDELERRVLFSVAAVFDLGDLTITGSNTADRISLKITPDGGNGTIVVKDGHTVVYNSVGRQDDVRSIHVMAGAGKDRIVVFDNGGAAEVTILGEDGNDRIAVKAFNVAGLTVSGGNGNDNIDVLFANAGVTGASPGGNSSAHSPTVGASSPGSGNSRAVIDGDAGNDKIRMTNSGGPAGIIHGGDGNDRILVATRHSNWGYTIFGDAGNDVIHGGAANDLIHGGDGKDRLFGEGGNDSLFGDAGQDYLRGGPGEDTGSA